MHNFLEVKILARLFDNILPRIPSGLMNHGCVKQRKVKTPLNLWAVPLILTITRNRQQKMCYALESSQVLGQR